MRFAINLLWVVFGGGLIVTIEWLLIGALLCLTLIGIPFGIACFHIAGLTIWPLGREAIRADMIGQKAGPGAGCANVIWFPAGLLLALIHAVFGFLLCVTIIGIPFGIIHFKLAEHALAPLGKRIVSTEMAQAARARALEKRLSGALGDPG
ncbi:MAG: YccF family protein [Planctomycetes bacterium]|nr:YccF family protein [Planctomycetota bacterium]NOG53086.1 YccF family protein [Planctomycetota bacterium]